MSAAEVLQLLTPEERAERADLEEKVVIGAAAAVMAGKALEKLRDRRLYRNSYASFEAYVQARFQFSRQRAYQLIEYWQTAQAFEERGLDVPPERITRALGGIVPDDYQVVMDVTKAVTGKDRPSSADVQGVADTVRSMAAGMHVEHPDTQQPVPFASLPPEKRTEAVKKAVQQGSRDRTTFQGTEDVKPWEWLDGLRQSGTTVAVIGDDTGWHVDATDRLTGDTRTGPTRDSQWDAIRAARVVWEGEVNHDEH